MCTNITRFFFAFPKIIWIIFLTQLIVACASPTIQDAASPEVQKTLHRNIRSPQLFSGRNVLSDLTQLKPPTLSDLNEFRQKMASLANLTALLENAIAAEKTARTTLHSFVNTIKEQILGVQKAVNPDPENYWTESKICGGILVSQTGRIVYKKNDYYKNHERCTWTIRANHRSKIRVTFSNGDLERAHDYVAVTEIINNGTETEWNTRRLIPGETVLFEGPLIFITFVSDGSIRRKGFQMEFEGMGSNINANTIYQHFHLSDWMGQFDSGNLSESLDQDNVKIGQGSQLIATMTVSPSNWNESKLLLSVPEDTLDLRPNECQKTNLVFLNDFASFPHGVSSRCCGGTCQVNNFETQNGIMVGILKSSDLTEGSHFQMNWSTDTSSRQIESVDKCGGILTGSFGRISYKENSPYDNNNRCVWIIQAESIKEGEIKVQLVKDGFEQQYDYVTLSYFTNDGHDILETKFLYTSGAPVLLPLPFALVEFYSDAGTFGKATGFELIWEIKQTSDNPVGIEIDYNTEESGSKNLQCTAQQQHFSIINANLHMQRLLSLKTEGPVDSEDFSVFISERGNFSKAESSNEYQSKDGVIAFLRKCSDGATGDVSVQWKTEETSSTTGESTDNKVHAKSEDTCGEILHADSGQIVYKIGKEYELNERCTWIIRAKSLSTITVQLMADGFESCCDGVHINKINSIGDFIDTEGIAISRENRFQTLDAEALLVTFFSDHSVKGTGFVLEFQTKGDPITNAGDVDITHSHVTLGSRPTPENPFGPIFIETSDNLLSIDTFAFQHVEIVAANTSVELETKNLQTNECNQDAVALYHMPVLRKYEMLGQIPPKEACSVERLIGRNSISALMTSEQGKVEVQPKGILVAVTKIKSAQSDKTVSLTFK